MNLGLSSPISDNGANDGSHRDGSRLSDNTDVRFSNAVTGKLSAQTTDGGNLRQLDASDKDTGSGKHTNDGRFVDSSDKFVDSGNNRFVDSGRVNDKNTNFASRSDIDGSDHVGSNDTDGGQLGSTFSGTDQKVGSNKTQSFSDFGTNLQNTGSDQHDATHKSYHNDLGSSRPKFGSAHSTNSISNLGFSFLENSGDENASNNTRFDHARNETGNRSTQSAFKPKFTLDSLISGTDTNPTSAQSNFTSNNFVKSTPSSSQSNTFSNSDFGFSQEPTFSNSKLSGSPSRSSLIHESLSRSNSSTGFSRTNSVSDNYQKNVLPQPALAQIFERSVQDTSIQSLRKSTVCKEDYIPSTLDATTSIFTKNQNLDDIELVIPRRNSSLIGLQSALNRSRNNSVDKPLKQNSSQLNFFSYVDLINNDEFAKNTRPSFKTSYSSGVIPTRKSPLGSINAKKFMISPESSGDEDEKLITTSLADCLRDANGEIRH